MRVFFKKMGITNLRFKPAYNPYTEVSEPEPNLPASPFLSFWLFSLSFYLCTISISIISYHLRSCPFKVLRVTFSTSGCFRILFLFFHLYSLSLALSRRSLVALLSRLASCVISPSYDPKIPCTSVPIGRSHIQAGEADDAVAATLRLLVAGRRHIVSFYVLAWLGFFLPVPPFRFLSPLPLRERQGEPSMRVIMIPAVSPSAILRLRFLPPTPSVHPRIKSELRPNCIIPSNSHDPQSPIARFGRFRRIWASHSLDGPSCSDSVFA